MGLDVYVRDWETHPYDCIIENVIYAFFVKNGYAPRFDKPFRALRMSLAQVRLPCVTRETYLPLLLSRPDGVQQVLVAQDPTINATCM